MNPERSERGLGVAEDTSLLPQPRSGLKENIKNHHSTRSGLESVGGLSLTPNRYASLEVIKILSLRLKLAAMASTLHRAKSLPTTGIKTSIPFLSIIKNTSFSCYLCYTDKAPFCSKSLAFSPTKAKSLRRALAD
jgi:hypothetical protein